MQNNLILISAYKLEPIEIDNIINGMQLAKTRDLVIENKVDKSILGGLIIKYKDYYLDLSIKSKLEDIVYNLS